MSSLQCPSSPTYHTSVQQKILSRDAARQYKFGSPKLRDLIREKCRIRVREARRASFDGTRDPDKIGDNRLFSKILRQELADLESDLELQENIYQELIGEMNMWFVEQLEEEEEYLIEVGDTECVFCPMCKKGALEISANKQMVCQCGACFNFRGTLQNINTAIQNAIVQHEVKCNQSLNFFVEQSWNGEHKHLNGICEYCDYLICLT